MRIINFPCAILTTFGLLSSTACIADTLTFDDLYTGTQTINTLSSVYRGYLFNGTLDALSVSDWGHGLPPSGKMAIINNYYGDGEITSSITGEIFSFSGLSIKSWGGYGTMMLEGYLNDKLVATKSFSITDNWQIIKADASFLRIEKLIIRNAGTFMIDDLKLSKNYNNVTIFPGSGVIPENTNFDIIVSFPEPGKDSTLGNFKITLNSVDISANCTIPKYLLSTTGTSIIRKYTKCTGYSSVLIQPGKNTLKATYQTSTNASPITSVIWDIRSSAQ